MTHQLRIAILSLLALTASLCAADQTALYLSWSAGDPATSMTVHHICAAGDSRQPLYLYTNETESLKVEPQIHPIPDRTDWVLQLFNLNALESDTRYTFSLGNSDQRHAFRTLPATLSAPLTFAVGGDLMHGDGRQYAEMCQQVAQHSPRFAIAGGDIAYSTDKLGFGSDSFDRWLLFLQVWERYMVCPSGEMIPIVPVIGNHDTIGRYHQKPQRAVYYYALFPRQQGYRILTCGDYLALFLMDSGHTHEVGKEQRNWLKSALAQNQAYPHRMAAYHIPAYPGKVNRRTHIIKSIQREWVPLFEQYGLQAAFEHHEHVYKRTHPLIGGKPTPDGVLYIGGGAWGASARTAHSPANYPYLAKATGEPNVVITEIYKKNHYKTINNSGKTIDYFEQEIERK